MSSVPSGSSATTAIPQLVEPYFPEKHSKEAKAVFSSFVGKTKAQVRHEASKRAVNWVAKPQRKAHTGKN